MKKPADAMYTPKEFWQRLPNEEALEILMTGELNKSQCELLWKLTERNSQPPESMKLWIDPDTLNDILSST